MATTKKIATKTTTPAAKKAAPKAAPTVKKPTVKAPAKATPKVAPTKAAVVKKPVAKKATAASPAAGGHVEATELVPVKRLPIPTTKGMLDSLHNLSNAHQTVLYAASVMRPSLALAQGHALSLLLGSQVAIYEFSCETTMAHFGSAIRSMILRLNKAAEEKGYIVSSEVGMESRVGLGAHPSTLRWLARDNEVAKMVVLYSNDVIVVHDLNGNLLEASAFPEALAIVQETHKQLEPTVKGYIHTVTMTQSGIVETSNENTVDPVIADVAYPFIKIKQGERTLGASDIAVSFLKSKSTVLNLYGVAGTGKSTLMSKIAKIADNRHCILVDNSVFYVDPNAASALIAHIRSLAQKGKRPLVLLEEVDDHLESKSNGNIFLQQLLSLTSGVIESDLKVITATNLKNRSKFADPLKRSGRTFANIEFLHLNHEQAVACAKAFGLDARDFTEGRNYQLADVLTEPVLNIGEDKNKVGFGS